MYIVGKSSNKKRNLTYKKRGQKNLSQEDLDGIILPDLISDYFGKPSEIEFKQ